MIIIYSDPSAPSRAGKALSENEIASELPTESSAKNGRLLDLALDSANAFIGSHSLNIKFPEDTTQEVARAIEEGKILPPSTAYRIFAKTCLLFS